MKRPKKAYYDFEKGVSNLEFSHDDSGEFLMKGGVCWPGVDDGFVVLCGQDVSTKKIHVFEQRPFVVVEDFFNEAGSREFEGLGQWFNRCWAKYFASKFYWDESKELVHQGFSTQIYRSATIKPRPSLIKIALSDGGKNLIYEQLRLGRLVIEEDTDLHNALKVLKADPKAELPALSALGCALTAYKKLPYRGDD